MPVRARSCIQIGRTRGVVEGGRLKEVGMFNAFLARQAQFGVVLQEVSDAFDQLDGD